VSDIFISYARSTAVEAGALGEALRGLGYSVWRDSDLPSHRPYGDVIAEQLGLAKAVVVVWSAEAVSSHWVRSEADRARADGKLVQLAVDRSPLPMPFDQIQCADLVGWTGQTEHHGWRKTLETIAVLAGARAASPPTIGIPNPAPEAAAAPAAAATGNLPRRQGALIGRRTELDQIAKLLESGDLVTITGPGGVGKTRIAVEFAHAQAEHHEDGAWLVELAPLGDAALVTAAIAKALRLELPPGRDPLDALIERLRPRDCLIVLDNCEHLIDAVARLAEAVLEQTTRVKLLASSQEPLGVEGERVFRLKSMDEADAAALFVERAQAVDAAWSPRPSDEPAIAAICQRLDGIPLALEMAAARAPALGCQGVLTRLDDRFRILTGGRRTALPRQRTLLATLEWSHGLLTPEDAAVFRRLGVFVGGFTMEAASKVAAGEALDEVQVIDAVASLVAKNLVAIEPNGEVARYRLLETTRMYALDQLAAAGETLAARRSHALWCDAFTAGGWADYLGLSDESFHARYAPEMANVEAGMEWAFGPDGDVDVGIALTAHSYPVWATQSAWLRYLSWGDQALGHCSDATSLETVLFLKANLVEAGQIFRPRTAVELGVETLPALRQAGDPVRLGQALSAVAHALRLHGRYEEARACAMEAETLIAALPASRMTVAVRFATAFTVYLDDPAQSLDLLRSVAKLARSIGADGWANLVTMYGLLSDVDADVEPALAESRALLEQIRPTHMFADLVMGNTCIAVAFRLAQRNAPGDLDEAWRLLRSLEKTAGRTIPVVGVRSFVELALSAGRLADAARIYGALTAGAARVGYHLESLSGVIFRSRQALLEHLDEQQLETFAAEGALLNDEQVYVLATNQES
jgi:predicted ATPase